jgi:hypothetical protein
MSVFEIASRKKLRFPSQKGDLTSEQLWDLPLTSANKFDLDTIARGINGELKSITEDGFVQTKPDPRKPDLETALEIVKRVIAVKIEEKDAAEKKAANRVKRQKLLEALAEREVGDLKAKSKEELLKELNDLDG